MIQRANRVWGLAFDEGKRSGLIDEAALWHAWATWWLVVMGYGFPGRPDIVSGYRSPSRQRELLERWRRGDRSGLVAKPACESWHTIGRAWDVQSDVSGFTLYADLLDFTERVRDGRVFGDPGHFDLPGPESPPNICNMPTV